MAALEDHRQELFCQKYCALRKAEGSGNKVRFNATQAAIAAGYSKKTAYSSGSRLLKRAEVKNRIDEIVKQQVDNITITSDRIIKELAFLGTADVSKAFDTNGNLLPIHEIPEDVRRAIAGFELVEERDENGEGTGHMTKKVKFWDKNTSLLGLAKVFKMLTDKVEHEHKVTLENFLGGTWPDENDQKGKSPKDKKK